MPSWAVSSSWSRRYAHLHKGRPATIVETLYGLGSEACGPEYLPPHVRESHADFCLVHVLTCWCPSLALCLWDQVPGAGTAAPWNDVAFCKPTWPACCDSIPLTNSSTWSLRSTKLAGVALLFTGIKKFQIPLKSRKELHICSRSVPKTPCHASCPSPPQPA